MPSYLYKAKDGPTRTVEGEVRADSRGAAAAMVESMGYSPILVRPKPEVGSGRRLRLWGRRAGPRDVTVFTRQLASLVRSGVPILRALSTVHEQTENRAMQTVVDDVETTIRDGSMLSGALVRHPSLFSDLYVNMVRSGESGGVLDAVLQRLADAREEEEALRRKVQAAVAYPVLILSVGAATVFVLLTFFLPRVVSLFRDYDRLPLPTRLLIGASDFFSESWHWLLLGILLLAAVLNRLQALDKGRTFLDRIKLHLPLFRSFIRDSDIARFSRTLALLMDAGIPIDRALSLSADTLRNAVFRAEIEKVRHETVQQGHPLSAGLKQAEHVPVFVANMAGVGEEAGTLGEALNEVAVFYEKEFDQRSKLATSLLEPVLILVVGVVVGFIVTAMLLPVFEIGTAF